MLYGRTPEQLRLKTRAEVEAQEPTCGDAIHSGLQRDRVSGARRGYLCTVGARPAARLPGLGAQALYGRPEDGESRP